MVWVRIDDRITEHPKIARVGALGLALQVAGLAYCNRNLTDGFVPRGVARTLLDWQVVDYEGRLWTVGRTSGFVGDDVTPEWVIDLLLDAGVWEEVEGGYRIHDFEDYQPTKADVEADRRERDAAKAAGGLARAAGAKRDQHGRFIPAGQTSDATSSGPSDGPAPVHLPSSPEPEPEPIRGLGSSETDRSVGGSGGERRQPTDTQTYLRNRLAEFDVRWVDVTDERLTEAAAQYGSASVLDVLQGARLKADDGTLGMIESPVAWFFVACRKAQGELGVSA